MAYPVIMPKSGQTVESCLLVEWHKAAGETVKKGDLLFSYETDKASFDEQAKEDGILLAVFAEEDEDVPCLSCIAVIGEQGEPFQEFSPKKQQGKHEGTGSPPPVENVPVRFEEQPAVTIGEAGGKKHISPRARMVAERMGRDARLAQPSGPNGRIIERDVRRLSQTDTPETHEIAAVERAEEATVQRYTESKHTNMRKRIANTMHQSISEMAQLSLHTSFDATSVKRLREQLKACATHAQEGKGNITINDMVLYAACKVLKKDSHAVLNAHYSDETLRHFGDIHLGVAVDTDRGLLVPTIFQADKFSLPELSSNVKTTAAMARSGDINPDLLHGATFTVTNLGSLGIEYFTPIINPPQTAILGVGCMTWRFKETGESMIPYPAIGLSLTFDHRAMDGAPAARFLKELKELLENFELALV